ncbi:raffinose/stachyose/melibiose transport system substrate-binding protein [Propionibacterium cyclohexanicum]|uniref:Raffinose/stachyose/melibiose transport system substrate-binding protein n=1 Tax=Propionibacterium cyclohexanicum TaxID=64702 RepID=A0A1H9TC71_9ACTN|nr:extracellular solute-binding protein [Propionibacterium cyclohexanicum]SER94708.1 raffinose/stachyose/melibiose transport system substrate-binding protein [Propionibacterium cyclohexanicum]
MNTPSSHSAHCNTALRATEQVGLSRRTLLRGGLGLGIAGLSAAALSACGSSRTSASSSGTISGTLEILTSSADASDAAFKKVNAAFQTKYPDVTVKFTSVPNDSYASTKSSRMTAGTVDLMVLKTFFQVPDYAKNSASDDVLLAENGGLVELTGKDFMNRYTPSVLSAQAIGGKQYGVPTGLSYSTGVFYNKKIFSEQGLSVPTTWTQLQEVMSTLTAKGVTPFGIGGKDTWPAGLAMLGSVAALYPDATKKENLAKAIWDGSVKLTDEGPLMILERTQTIFQNGQQNFAGAGYDDIPSGFAAGKYAMTIDGTWNEPTIASAVNGAFEIGFFPLPISDTAADNALLNGKIELQLGIPTSSKNQAAALAWLEFFSQADSYKGFLATSGFSSAQPDIAATDFLKSIEQMTSTFQPAWDQLWIASKNAGQDALYPFNYPALSPLGSKTAQQAASDAAAAWSTN